MKLVTRFVLAVGLLLGLSVGHAQEKSAMPWMSTALGPDERTALVMAQMTQAEKLQLVEGIGWGVLKPGAFVPPEDVGGAGFVPGLKRLGIPDINLADSAVGVRMSAYRGRYSTALPSALGAAASWDIEGARLYGDVIGRELRAQGFNMSIGGGVNLTREPRNGRNFEYAGEDPLLAGTMVGNLIKGLEAEQVMGDIKHFALNDQETGRNVLNVVLDHKSMRESDLLAFQIAIGIANPSAVMCSYNKVDGDYACENDYLLNQVLKKDWGFKGWVMSDWEATHSTVKAALNGLDQEQPGGQYFNEALAKAVKAGKVPQARLDDMVHRVLRSMFASGVVDNPPVPSVPDPFRGRDDAQHIAEEGTVLLRNKDGVLPLRSDVRSIALIGGHADVGVLSGAGSAQVDAPGGNAADPKHGGTKWCEPVYFPSSPLKELSRLAPEVKMTYTSDADLDKAATAARAADVAIVFATQHMCESRDAATLSLPGNQNALVSAVAKANPKTIVVLETGGPVAMPWRDEVAGIVEAWYPGIGGAQAMANLLYGKVNFSGKLPVTFAAADADLPHPTVPGLSPRAAGQAGGADGESAVKTGFDVNYTEGVRFGYKWFDSENKVPLYPFGFGLSYTEFAYSGLKVDEASHALSFTVKNTGEMAGDEIAQVYVELPKTAGENFKRMAGWSRLSLAPGQSREVTVELNTLTMSIFDEAANQFTMPRGDYRVMVGSSSRQIGLSGTLAVR